MTVGDGLLYLRVVFAEALAETFLLVAAPPHPYEIIGRRECKKHAEQNIVKSTHYLSQIRFPYRVPQTQSINERAGVTGFVFTVA